MELGKCFTSSRDTLLCYDYVAGFLKLNKEDRDINKRLLNDAFQDITFYIGRNLDFTAETLPDDIKEAGIALFTRKHSMYKKAADYATGDDMEDIIEQKLENGILDYDDFFGRFSEIPYDVEILLEKYKTR